MNQGAALALGAVVHQGDLLGPSVRREITDLNRLYLERALDLVAGADAWFRLPEPAAGRLAVACDEVLERAAQCPVALFEIRLPEGPVHAGAVADRPIGEPLGGAVAEARRAFGVTVLGVLRRLVDAVPLTTRIAFGLEHALEARLRTMTLSECFRLAAWPGLIQPRWGDHDRYWHLLAEAALRGEGLHWAFTTGLCLGARCERQPATIACPARRPRPTHRRVIGARREVPC